jgi:hypothetical protein
MSVPSEPEHFLKRHRWRESNWKKTFIEFKNIEGNGTYQILGYATVNLLGDNINTTKIKQMLY